MKKNFFILLASSLLFFYCNPKPQNDVSEEMARAYYDSINHIINHYQPIQQKFVDELTIAHGKLKLDKNAIIDTVKLFSLFDSAYRSNRITLEKMESIFEVDTIINYKGKVIKYIKQFNELYEKEFPDYIRLLGGRELSKMDKYGEHFLPKLLASKEYGKIFKEAQTEFKTKYNFTTPKE